MVSKKQARGHLGGVPRVCFGFVVNVCMHAMKWGLGAAQRRAHRAQSWIRMLETTIQNTRFAGQDDVASRGPVRAAGAVHTRLRSCMSLLAGWLVVDGGSRYRRGYRGRVRKVSRAV